MAMKVIIERLLDYGECFESKILTFSWVKKV